MDAEWVEWNPKAVPHVVGRYEKRQEPEPGHPAEQTVEATCNKCGGKLRTVCSSGNVRQHILRFAVHHMHSDPLDVPRVTRPGSLRRKAGPSGDYE